MKWQDKLTKEERHHLGQIKTLKGLKQLRDWQHKIKMPCKDCDMIALKLGV